MTERNDSAELRALIGESRASGDDRPQIPLIDPTANVLALVAAEVKRQDDLRLAGEKYAALAIQRQDDLREMLEKCQAEVSAVHLAGNAALAVAETKRIDALLLAAKSDVALASEKSAAQAATLAQQVATTAEASRGAVSTLAQQTAAQTQQMREALERRLTLLEQSQYSIGGRDTQRSEGRQGGQWVIGVAIGAAIGLVGLMLSVVALLAR